MAFKLYLKHTLNDEFGYDLAEILSLNPADFLPWQADIIEFIQLWQQQKALPVNTSGSTGQAKQILLEPYIMRNSALRTIKFFNISETDNALLCLPAKYIAGKMMIVRALVGQYQLYCIEPIIKLDLANLYQKRLKFKFAALIPAQLINLKAKYLACFTQILLGGAKSSEHSFSDLKTAIDLYKVKIFEGYGMTETASHVALRQLWQNEWFELLPDIKVRLKDHCLGLKIDENQPWLQTNDLVEFKSADSFRILGRADNVINSGGLKIIVETLEATVLNKFGCQIYLTAKNDIVFGKKAVICMLEQDKFLQDKLLDFLFPQIKSREIIFLSEFPLTKNNKIDRLKLSSFSEN